MKILEDGPDYTAWVNEDGTEIKISRHRNISRGSLSRVSQVMSRGVWVAHGLSEGEDGMLHERWIKHAA